jgi:hypothetical protein
MIVAGNREEFAVMAEINGQYPDFLYGSFQFQFHGESCGNWEDEAHLNACYGWLREFSQTSMPRFEAGLLDVSCVEIFHRLVKPVLVGMRDDDGSVPEIYNGTFARFHITHIGMSSFDGFVVVLIENSDAQRCVWAKCDDWLAGIIKEAVYPSGYMQRVAGEFCELFKMEALKCGFSL